MRLGCLSEKYEGGGPGTISTGTGDSGGVSYGTYQLASATGSAGSFVDWLRHRDDYGAGYGDILAQAIPGSLEFSASWSWLAETDAAGFEALQESYVWPKYYDAAVKDLRECMNTERLPDAIKCVIFSNAIQHGPYWAGRLVAETYDPDPAEWIRKIYDMKIADLSWSSGAPDLRPGLFARWENEKQDALILLAGGEI